jgi:hypothetical protein
VRRRKKPWDLLSPFSTLTGIPADITIVKGREQKGIVLQLGGARREAQAKHV